MKKVYLLLEEEGDHYYPIAIAETIEEQNKICKLYKEINPEREDLTIEEVILGAPEDCFLYHGCRYYYHNGLVRNFVDIVYGVIKTELNKVIDTNFKSEMFCPTPRRMLRLTIAAGNKKEAEENITRIFDEYIKDEE